MRKAEFLREDKGHEEVLQCTVESEDIDEEGAGFEIHPAAVGRPKEGIHDTEGAAPEVIKFQEQLKETDQVKALSS